MISLEVDRRIEERVKERATNKDEVLVFGSSKGKIYAFDGEVIKRITRREGVVGDFAVWNGKLYDGGDYKKIYETLTDKVISERKGWVSAVDVLDGELIHAENYFLGRGRIYKTLNDEVIAERKWGVDDMTVLYGELYSAEGWRICKPLYDEVIAERSSSIRALTNYKGELYEGIGREIYRPWDKKYFGPRPDVVLALGEWNGKLIDAGPYGVYETMNNELIFDDFEVTSMIGVEREVLKGLI